MGSLMVSVSGVRGIIGEDVHPLLVARWAAAFSGLLDDGPVVLGRDSRPSGELFCSVARDVLVSLGRSVFDIGIVPTPTVQMAVEAWSAAGGLILTASHNPAPWNALKFVGPDGSFLGAAPFAELRARAEGPERGPGGGAAGFLPFEAWGSTEDRAQAALRLHREAILALVDRGRIASRRPRVLLDCVHGAGGTLLPPLIRELGADLVVRHIEPNGLFPRNPEPTGEALELLAAEGARLGADLAIAVDPDADRCGMALPGTSVVGEEWTLPLVASHLLQTRRGPLVTNLSTSSRLEAVAAAHGCRVHRSPVGEAHVVGRMRAVDAVLGGEGNGGVIDPRVHLGRDAAVAVAWLLEAESTVPGGLRGLASAIPPRYLVKEKFPAGGERVIDRAAQNLEDMLGVPEDTSDGLRWTLPEGFVHLRSSATEPIVRLVVETSSTAETESMVARIRTRIVADRG